MPTPLIDIFRNHSKLETHSKRLTRVSSSSSLPFFRFLRPIVSISFLSTNQGADFNAKEVLVLTENELKRLEEKNQILQTKVSQLETALEKAKKAEMEASAIASSPHVTPQVAATEANDSHPPPEEAPPKSSGKMVTVPEESSGGQEIKNRTYTENHSLPVHALLRKHYPSKTDARLDLEVPSPWCPELMPFVLFCFFTFSSYSLC